MSDSFRQMMFAINSAGLPSHTRSSIFTKDGLQQYDSRRICFSFFFFLFFLLSFIHLTPNPLKTPHHLSGRERPLGHRVSVNIFLAYVLGPLPKTDIVPIKNLGIYLSSFFISYTACLREDEKTFHLLLELRSSSIHANQTTH